MLRPGARYHVPPKRTCRNNKTMQHRCTTVLVLFLLVITSLVVGQRTRHRDPCDPTVHEVISEPERSLHHALEGHPRCDDQLVPGWYRFDGPAGSTVPTECPGRNFCGTKAPMWMNGTVPDEEDGAVKATACVTLREDCCGVKVPMRVRNCSEYLVYYLRPPPGCPAAYCAGTEVPCPEGLTSNTGYTPCQFPVEIAEAKVTFGASDDGKRLVAYCDAVLDGLVGMPKSVLLEVTWIVDGDEVQTDTFALTDKQKGTLETDKWEMGQEVRCGVRAKHRTINAFTERVTSGVYRTGIVITSPPLIRTLEDGPVAFWEFRLTVPVLCKEDKDCCIVFRVSAVRLDDNARCPSGGSNDQVVLLDCEYSVCKAEWNDTHRVALWARPDRVRHTRESYVELSAVVSKGDAYNWKGYHTPLQEVEVIPDDAEYECVSDTHLTTFTDAHLKLQDGTYVMYLSDTSEVQIHYKRCTYRDVCNCGVAVRFGEVAVGFDVCTHGYLQFWTRTEAGVPAQLGDIHPLMQVVRATDGRTFQVVLPSGTMIEIGPLLSYIRIVSTHLTAGLCTANETRAWEVNRRRSLFAGSFTAKDDTSHDDFLPKCGCKPVQSNPEQPDEEVQCHVSQCVDVRGDVVTSEMVRYAADEDHDVDLTRMSSASQGDEVSPGESSGRSVSADGECWGAMHQRALDACGDIVPEGDHIARVCTSDVKHSNNAGWASVSSEYLRNLCLHRISTSAATWSEKRTFLDRVCPGDCSGNGKCVSGTCECYAAWGGAACEVAANVPPAKVRLRTKTCDVRTKPCLSVMAIGEFASSRVTCEWEIYTYRYKNETRTRQGTDTTEAAYINHRVVVCPLPQLPIHDTRSQPFFLPGESLTQTRALLNVRLRYDHSPLSEPMSLLLYDSICWQCSGASSCTAKRTNDCLLEESYDTFNFEPEFNTHVRSTDPCSMSSDPGTCNKDSVRYYYDRKEHRCRPFVYGGCDGNENNFESPEACRKQCN